MGLGGVELVASRVKYGEYLVTTRRRKPAPQQQGLRCGALLVQDLARARGSVGSAPRQEAARWCEYTMGLLII